MKKKTPIAQTLQVSLLIPERESLAFKGHIKPKHIKVPYVSPVLKREEMLLNPDSNTNNNLTSVPVVRTLQNYKQYKGNIYKK